jgi:hypothetical protein
MPDFGTILAKFNSAEVYTFMGAFGAPTAKPTRSPIYRHDVVLVCMPPYMLMSVRCT